MKSLKVKVVIASFLFALSLFYFVSTAYGTTISSSYISQENSVFNSSGFYYSSEKAFSRSSDVVVCRGSSALNDLYKQFTCDIVCYSTDTDCSDEIESAMTNGGFVYLSSGVYPIESYITPVSDTRLIGAGSKTILNLTGTDEVFYSTGDLSNFELGFVNFIDNSGESSIGFEISEAPSSNIYLHDIDFGNINRDCFRFSTNSGTTDVHSNIVVQNIKCTDASFLIGKIEHFKLLDSYFDGSSSDRNTLADLGFSENSAIIDDVLIQGNTFKELRGSNPILSSSEDSIAVRIIDNVFYSNNSAIFWTLNSFDYYADLLISGNSFYAGDSHAGSALIDIRTRATDSLIQITNNNFYGIDEGMYQGIYSTSKALISGNTFNNFGDSCIMAKTSLQIIDNQFYGCAMHLAGNRWIYFEPSADYEIRNLIANNFFMYATQGYTGELIRLVGVENTTIQNNYFDNMDGNGLYLLEGVAVNNTYIDNYVYPSIANLKCVNSPDSVFYGKYVSNTTDLCRCIAGSWKCGALA